ncbi:hypothetical protein Tco_1556234 [Tanacetum coccineum]
MLCGTLCHHLLHGVPDTLSVRDDSANLICARRFCGLLRQCLGRCLSLCECFEEMDDSTLTIVSYLFSLHSCESPLQLSVGFCVCCQKICGGRSDKMTSRRSWWVCYDIVDKSGTMCGRVKDDILRKCGDQFLRSLVVYDTSGVIELDGTLGDTLVLHVELSERLDL